jgi:hypothetical protein
MRYASSGRAATGEAATGSTAAQAGTVEAPKKAAMVKVVSNRNNEGFLAFSEDDG